MAGIKSITMCLFILRIVRMIISMVSVTITAQYFGVSIEKDCWVLVLAIVSTTVQAVWGPLNEIFRAKYVLIQETEGKKSALMQTSSLLGFVLHFSIFLCILIFLFSGSIANILTNGIAQESYSLFSILLILILPTIITSEIGNIFISILNAFEVYYIPETMSCISGIVSIFIIMTFAPSVGIFAMVISQYIGTLLLIVVLIYFLKKNEIDIWTHILRFKFAEAKPFLIYSLPFFFPYFVGQLNFMGEKYLASSIGEGCVSMLDYSRQFINILQTVLSSVLTTVMVPFMAKSYAQKNADSCKDIVRENLTVSLMIVIAGLTILIGATDPVCRYFFDRGKVTEEQLQIIVNLTRFFSIVFFGVYLYVFFGSVLLATDKAKFYAKCGVATQIVVLAGNVLLYQVIGNIYIFPISYGIAHLVCGLIFITKLTDVLPVVIKSLVVKSVMSILILSMLLVGFNSFVFADYPLIQIISSGLLTLIIMLPIALFMGYDVVGKFCRMKSKLRRWTI